MYIIFSSYFCIRTTLDSTYNVHLFHFKHSIIIFSTKVLQYSFTTIHHDPNITIIKIRPGDLCSYENILHFQNFLVFLSNCDFTLNIYPMKILRNCCAVRETIPVICHVLLMHHIQFSISPQHTSRQ